MFPKAPCLISVLWLAAGDPGSWKSLRRDPGGGWDLQRICCQENGHWPQRASVRDDPQWKQRAGPPGCHRYDLTGVATWSEANSSVWSCHWQQTPPPKSISYSELLRGSWISWSGVICLQTVDNVLPQVCFCIWEIALGLTVDTWVQF